MRVGSSVVRDPRKATMYFPNADVVIHPALLVFLGVIVGMLGGFFGVGGGFLITGGLLVFGVPPVYAVGTGLTLVMGTSIINTLKHRNLGNVDFKLGALMVTGTIPAIFLAEWVNATLEAAGIAGPVIRYVYVGFLASLGLFILYDFWRTWLQRGRHSGGGEEITTAGLTERVRSLRIPPHRIGIPRVWSMPTLVSWPVMLLTPSPMRPFMRRIMEQGVSTYVSLPVSGIERISVFVPVGIGFGIGFIAGLLGAGGGFILMPVLIFVLGVPTTIAIGTDLFQIIITGSVGSFAYALSDRVDPLMAVLMLTAASIGSQLGARATQRVDPSRIRFLYGLLIITGAVAVALEEISQAVPGASVLSDVASVVLLGSGGGMCIVLLVMMARSRERREGGGGH